MFFHNLRNNKSKENANLKGSLLPTQQRVKLMKKQEKLVSVVSPRALKSVEEEPELLIYIPANLGHSPIIYIIGIQWVLLIVIDQSSG